jgi:hypothetical protein
MPRERAVVVLGLPGDFDAEPGRTVKAFILTAKLDLGGVNSWRGAATLNKEL